MEESDIDSKRPAGASTYPARPMYIIPLTIPGTLLNPQTASNDRKTVDGAMTSRSYHVSATDLSPAEYIEYRNQNTNRELKASSVCKSSFNCPICDRQFSRDKYLDMHMSLHKTSETELQPVSQPDPAEAVRKLTGTGNNLGTNEMYLSGNSYQNNLRTSANDVTAVATMTSLQQSSSGHSVMSSFVDSGILPSVLEKCQKIPIARTPIQQEGASLARPNNQWSCNICHKIFSQNSSFRNHMRTHSSERPYVCEICSIGFKERYHLKKHLLFKHSSEAKEECKICGKRFKDSTAIRAHERIHSDVRPYSCCTCGKSFKTSECLWHHTNRSKKCGMANSRTPARQSTDVKPTRRQESPLKSANVIQMRQVVHKPAVETVTNPEKLIELNKIQLGMTQGLFIPLIAGQQSGLINTQSLDFSKMPPWLLASSMSLLSNSLAMQKAAVQPQIEDNKMTIGEVEKYNVNVSSSQEGARLNSIKDIASTATALRTSHESNLSYMKQINSTNAINKPTSTPAPANMSQSFMEGKEKKSNALAVAEALLSSCTEAAAKTLKAAEIKSNSSGSPRQLHVYKSYEEEKEIRLLSTSSNSTSVSPTVRLFTEFKKSPPLLGSPSETDKPIVYDEMSVKSSNPMKLAIINDPSLASNARSPGENPFDLSSMSSGDESILRRDGLSLLASCAIDMPESDSFLRSSRTLMNPHDVKVEQEVELPDYELTAMTSPAESSLTSSPYYEKATAGEYGEEQEHIFLSSPEINSPEVEISCTTSVELESVDHISLRMHDAGSFAYNQKLVCNRCGKYFSSAASFEKHAIAHNENRPYRCDVCDIGFKLKVHLKKHDLYRHSNVYPCKCKECGKPFKDTSALRLHERTHSTSRPFACPRCFKTFKTRENLWGHRNRGPCSSASGSTAIIGTNIGTNIGSNIGTSIITSREVYESSQEVSGIDYNGNTRKIPTDGLMDDGRVYMFDQECVEEHVVETEMEDVSDEQRNDNYDDVDDDDKYPNNNTNVTVNAENMEIRPNEDEYTSGQSFRRTLVKPDGQFRFPHATNMQTNANESRNLNENVETVPENSSIASGGFQLPPLCYYAPYLTRFGTIVYFASINGETVMLFGNPSLNQYTGTNLSTPLINPTGLDQLLSAATAQVLSSNTAQAQQILSSGSIATDSTGRAVIDGRDLETGDMPCQRNRGMDSECSAELGSAAAGRITMSAVLEADSAAAEAVAIAAAKYSGRAPINSASAAVSAVHGSTDYNHGNLGGHSGNGYQSGGRVPTAVVNPIKRSSGATADGAAGASKHHLPPFESLVAPTFRQPSTSQPNP